MGNSRTPARQGRPCKEAVRLGKEIYQRRVLPQVKTGPVDEYVAMDVGTPSIGHWAGLSHMKFQTRHSGFRRSPGTGRGFISATKLAI